MSDPYDSFLKKIKRVIIVYTYKYYPKPQCSNFNAVKPVNSRVF